MVCRGRRDGSEVDAADDLAVAQHVVIVVPALQAGCRYAEGQVIHPADFVDSPASVLLFRAKELFAGAPPIECRRAR